MKKFMSMVVQTLMMAIIVVGCGQEDELDAAAVLGKEITPIKQEEVIIERKEENEIPKEEINKNEDIKEEKENIQDTTSDKDIYDLKSLEMNGKTLEEVLSKFFTQDVKWINKGEGNITFQGTSNYDNNVLPMRIEYTIKDGEPTGAEWYLNDEIMSKETVAYTVSIMCSLSEIELDYYSYAIISGSGKSMTEEETKAVESLMGVQEEPQNNEQSNIMNNRLLFASMITAGLAPGNEDQMLNMFLSSGPKFTLAFSVDQLLDICGGRVGLLDYNNNGFSVGLETDNHAWVFYCDLSDSNVYMIDCVNLNTGKKVPLNDSINYLQSPQG